MSRMEFAIWGSSGHALVLHDIISAKGDSVIVLFDNDRKAKPIAPGIPLFHGEEGFHSWIAQGAIAEVGGVVAIGGGRGADRRRLLRLFAANGMACPSIIHPQAMVAPSSTIGNGCQILMGASISSAAVLEDGCIVNTRAGVDHECYLGAGTHIGPGATLCGCVQTGQDCFVGAGAVILPRIKIGNGATIGAGAVVTRDVAAGAIAVGMPARQRTINK